MILSGTLRRVCGHCDAEAPANDNLRPGLLVARNLRLQRLLRGQIELLLKLALHLVLN